MSNNSALVVTSLPQYVAAVDPGWLNQRQELLETAGFITAITNTETQNEAVAATAALKKFCADIESTREELKKPILEAGRVLDKTAKDVVAPAKTQIDRLEHLLSQFFKAQVMERQRVLREQEEAARKIREEQDRAEKAEQARIAALEAQRLAAERLALEARSKAARMKAAAEAEQLRKNLDEAAFAADFKTSAPAPVFIAPPTVEKPQGAQTKLVVKYEVKDIDALYRAHPECVTLTVNKTRLNFLLGTPGIDLTSVPGVLAWEEIDTAVRK